MADGLFLINLENGDVWQFQYFPPRILREDRANWEAQDVLSSMKPLVYANNEPHRITISDTLLDFHSSDKKLSVAEAIDELRSLMSPSEFAGAPPVLRLISGSFQKSFVLEELRVEEQMYTKDGVLLRASLSLTLVEFIRIERVTSRVREPDNELPASGVMGQVVR
jgi:hypothetical protein